MMLPTFPLLVYSVIIIAVAVAVAVADAVADADADVVVSVLKKGGTRGSKDAVVYRVYWSYLGEKQTRSHQRGCESAALHDAPVRGDSPCVQGSVT